MKVDGEDRGREGGSKVSGFIRGRKRNSGGRCPSRAEKRRAAKRSMYAGDLGSASSLYLGVHLLF